MSCDRSLNDALLHPFLMAEDVVEAQTQLMILLSNHAEPRIKSIVVHRLRSFPHIRASHPDFEDVFSEAKMRVLAYLQDLKARVAEPCKDFLSYVGAIADIACTDFFRERYPVRARLYKAIRDSLNNPKFVIWKVAERRAGEWLAGLANSPHGDPSHDAAVTSFRDQREALTERLSSIGDVQGMRTIDLLRAVLEMAGKPIRVTDLVDLIAELRGIRDYPPVSLESGETSNWLGLSDSTARIDSILEMREPLICFWTALRALPRKELSAYLLYARDASGEDLISLLIWAKVASAKQIAAQLGIPLERFENIFQRGLPLDNESIAMELDIRIDRVYRLRHRAGKRLEGLVAKLYRAEK